MRRVESSASVGSAANRNFARAIYETAFFLADASAAYSSRRGLRGIWHRISQHRISVEEREQKGLQNTTVVATRHAAADEVPTWHCGR
jgi:hypothetical protein